MKRIFIIGVEGSGTTMLSRILSRVPQSVSVLGNYISDIIEGDSKSKKLCSQLKGQTQVLWDTKGSLKEFKKARIEIPHTIEELENHLSRKFGIETFIYKRSSPFGKENRYIPDLVDVIELFDHPKVIGMLRDPKQSSYSALRRGFLDDIKQCATVCHINLTLLTSMLKNIENSFVINYGVLLDDTHKVIQGLSEFLEVNNEILLASIKEEKLVSTGQNKYLEELDLESIDFLNEYFKSNRRASYYSLD